MIPRQTLILLCTLSLSACGAAGSRPVGADIDQGGFGNATMNNTLVQTGQRDATHALGSRFAAEVPSTITFAFDSAALSAEAAAILSRQANWIRQFPELRFSVYGHADAIGSAAANKALGQRRAQTVVDYFASQGISPARLQALVSYGESRPAVASDGPEQQNRRTVTAVSGFVQSHPATLNGKYADVVIRQYIGSATSLAGTPVQAGAAGAAPPAAPPADVGLPAAAAAVAP